MSPTDPFLSYWYLLVAGTLILLGLLVLFSSRLAQSKPGIAGLDRKLFHVGVFSAAAPVQLAFGFWGVVLYGSTVGAIVFLALRQQRPSRLMRVLGREEDGQERRTLVLLPLLSTALGGLLSVLLVGDFAVVGYLACGWGDAGGEVVGRSLGRRPFRVPLPMARPPRRTVEGSVAVLLLGGLGGWAALGLLHFTFLPSLMVGVACGLAAAVGEAFSPRGTDNLLCQLLPSLIAWWLLG